MTSHFARCTDNYFSFLLRGWRGMDEHGETVWRFTLVAPSDGNAHRLNDLHELCQFLRVETDELERAADAVKI